MQETGYRVYRYRWILLIIILPIIMASEIFWLSFATVSDKVQTIYDLKDSFGIDIFSISYMVMYILFMTPASWVIDKYGYRASVIIGSVLTAIFGFTRFLFAGNYTLLLVSQFLLAAGQPFLVNVSTKVPANWFPVKERSTAAGLLVMAQYIGFAIAMKFSPFLLGKFGVDLSGVKSMLGVYAAFGFFAALLAVFLTKEKPPVPPGPEAPKEMMTARNIGKLLINKNYIWVLIISFISMGLFNTLMTTLQSILAPRGFGGSADDVGWVFVVSGIVGAFVVPILSDKIGRRVPLFIAGIALLGPLCLGLTFFPTLPQLFVTASALGFLIMGLAPVLFQHGAEVAYPVPEGTSFGFVMMVGQISGAAFVVLFDQFQTLQKSIAPQMSPMLLPMLFLIVLAVLQFPITMFMKESETIRSIAPTEATEEP